MAEKRNEDIAQEEVVESNEDIAQEEVVESNEDITQEEIEVKNLIAVLPILFESHLYNPGDKLPAHNHEMVEAWIAHGSAEWRAANEDKKVVARQESATAGLAGRAIPESEEDLAGKLPSSQVRGRKRK